MLFFSKGKIKNHYKFTFGKDPIEVCDDYTYLGTLLYNYNGKFTKAIDKQVTQARRAMYSLKAKAQHLNLPIDIQCDLFDVFVTPILL